jgi:molybdopterin-guanine dinucleotide biosynthesis protein A
MGRDKGAIVYPPLNISQRARCHALLQPFCERVYISCREEQRHSIEPDLPLIIDSLEILTNGAGGPGVGILSATHTHPGHAWLVLACDFPYALEEDIAFLVSQRSSAHDATCFVHPDHSIEPLFGVWEAGALDSLMGNFQSRRFSPSATLSSLNCKKIKSLRPKSLFNVNSPTGA